MVIAIFLNEVLFVCCSLPQNVNK